MGPAGCGGVAAACLVELVLVDNDERKLVRLVLARAEDIVAAGEGGHAPCAPSPPPPPSNTEGCSCTAAGCTGTPQSCDAFPDAGAGEEFGTCIVDDNGSARCGTCRVICGATQLARVVVCSRVAVRSDETNRRQGQCMAHGPCVQRSD